MKSIPIKKSSSGFTLIELLVSIVISIIILAGVIQVVLSSRQSYQSNQEISFIQENARFVIDMLSRDIRMAGYRGCQTSDTALANVISGAEPGDFVSTAGIEGYDGDIAPKKHHLAYDDNVGEDYESDSLIIRRGDFENEFELAEHIKDSSNLVLWSDSATLQGGTELEGDSVFVISDLDCRTTSIFVAGVSGDTLTYKTSDSCGNQAFRGNFDCSGVTSSASGKSRGDLYSPGSRVMRYFTSAYYIAESESAPGVPALMRERDVLKGDGSFDTRKEELAIGIENLQFLYGLDTDGDGRVNYFVEANDSALLRTYDAEATMPEETLDRAQSRTQDWSKVVAVKVDITFRSEAQLMGPEEGLGELTDAKNDQYMRQLVSTTIKIRNGRGRIL